MFGSVSSELLDVGIEQKNIPIELIDDVSNNPRYAQADGVVYNERYEELKESIKKQKGRYLTLEVTPTNGRYMIFKGGSTRLQIARELYEYKKLEGTLENPFAAIQCLVYPKVEKSVQLVMTATENITRGELCYGEKARAMQYIIEAYLDASSEVFTVPGFLDYIDQVGAKALVPSRQEYYNLQGCYTHFLSVEVLCRKIIAGRAHREWVRSALRIRKEYIESSKKQGIDEALAESSWRILCIEVDSEELKLSNLQKVVENRLNRKSTDRHSDTVPGEGDDPVEVSYEDMLGRDVVKNAETILTELVVTGGYQSSRKKTNKLKSMGVSNDLSGFLTLLRKLPKKKQKTIIKQALSS